MGLFDCIEKRYSCRDFDTERMIEKEKIVACIDAARRAPSACNSQPWYFTVCQKDNEAIFNKLISGCGLEINKFVNSATTLVIVSETSYNASVAFGAIIKKQDFKSNDIGCAVGYFTLMAEEQGLGACILGWFNEKNLQKATGIKNKIRLVIAMGYAKDTEKLHNIKRKPVEEVSNWL